ncbi:hypothetical protein [Nocardioides jensenii]|uniref:hypothetical protein n=1 Tax=Nocardioides jensenii TaxID=1843 RepID=UPI00082A32BD|nr:hypothetical protein [Nocardioides jensenii]
MSAVGDARKRQADLTGPEQMAARSLTEQAITRYWNLSPAKRESAPDDRDALAEVITIPRPTVPFGPKHLTQDEADADYLRSAARNIWDARCMGSNLTATVVKLLNDCADRIAGDT